MSTTEKVRSALAAALQKRGRQAEISATFNVHPSTVRRWAEGGDLTAPVVALLDWYFFGVVPPKIQRGFDARTVLEFSAAEWAVIGALARRSGVTEAEWIASRVRDYLAMLSPGEPSMLAVAEAPPAYGKAAGK